MQTFSNIFNGEPGSSVRGKLNNVLTSIISGSEGINAIWAKIESVTQRINGMDSGISHIVKDTSYSPSSLDPYKDAVLIALCTGTFNNIKDKNGTPITIPGSNALTIFYRAANTTYWEYDTQIISPTVDSYESNDYTKIGSAKTHVMTHSGNAIKPMTDFNSVFDANGKSLTEFESGIIYDVSAHNNGEVFESLSALLNGANLSTLIPTSVRHRGMSIRFINSYDKYVQYRYTGIETTGNPNPFLDIANWRCTDSTIIFESAEVKASILPNELNKWGKIKSLTIKSFQGAQEGYVNEYMLEFIVSGDDFTLTLPEGVRWVEEPTWKNGYTYQVSIVNNLAVFAGWEAQTDE